MQFFQLLLILDELFASDLSEVVCSYSNLNWTGCSHGCRKPKYGFKLQIFSKTSKCCVSVGILSLKNEQLSHYNICISVALVL